MTGSKNSRYYPEHLRLIHYVDIKLNKRFFFLTNNFSLSPLTIARLYKYRWQIELFFKWIKQHLRIKAFYGTTPNAVKTQVWIAVSVYVQIAIIKKELQIDRSLAEILQIPSIALFEQVLLKQILTEISMQNEIAQNHNQLLLFNL
ncbi:MAG: transposase [Sedimentisphaerales bacterium]|nr:transposase [Sedimentisphaerales bacterium]